MVNKIKEPEFQNIGDRLILANHSLKQLNIIDDNYKGKNSSVLSLLNKCVTSMGKRAFVYKFLNPSTNVDFLEKEYNIIEHCLENGMDLYNCIKPELVQISDITKMSRQIIIQKISPKNLYQLYGSLTYARNIFKLIFKDIFCFIKFKMIICLIFLGKVPSYTLYCVQQLREYDGKQLVCVTKEGLKFDENNGLIN